jgi:hypothetical protein
MERPAFKLAVSFDPRPLKVAVNPPRAARPGDRYAHFRFHGMKMAVQVEVASNVLSIDLRCDL